MSVIQGEKKKVVTNEAGTFHGLDLQELMFPLFILCIPQFEMRGMMTR